MKNRNDIHLARCRLSIIFSLILLAVLVVPHFSSADTFEYDQLNRLTRVVYDNGKTVTYTYDAAGNIIATNEDHANGSDTNGGDIDGGSSGGFCFIATTARGNHVPAGNLLIFSLFCLASTMAIGWIRK